MTYDTDTAWHQLEQDERRRQEDELIAKHRRKQTYYRRVLRDWMKAFDKRFNRCR